MDAANAGTLTIDRLALLQFLDVKSDDSRGHATGIVSVVGEDLNAACFQHYAESKGATVEVLPGPVTIGKKKGPRLDRWIKADWPDDRGKILYQTEIKNWSAHAIGGRELQVNAKPDEIAAYKQKCWHRHWNPKSNTLKGNLCAKVLVPMKRPDGLEARDVRPLLIFWEALGHKKAGQHLFSVNAYRSKSQFPELCKFSEPTELWVFSVSSYLRSLKKTHICLRMPHAARRMRALTSMFSIGG